jgi:ArsR family transcriptional regulator, cadmium/lead-responsive transcriptional repressor
VEILTHDSSLAEREELSEAFLLARVFAGLSDPTRLQLLLILLEGEHNVSELVTAVGSSQGRVSVHLQCLRWCGFVVSERRGKYVYYRVRDEWVRELIGLAQAFAGAYHHELVSCVVLDSEAKHSERVAI